MHLKFMTPFSSLWSQLSLSHNLLSCQAGKTPVNRAAEASGFPVFLLPDKRGLTVRTNNPKPFTPLPPPLTARRVSHSLIKETMKRTHQDILVRTVISSNKLLPHLVTFMGQGNHMAHAAGSRSTPANLMLLYLTLIILKDCGVPNSKVFHHPYIPNACNSLSMTKLRSFLPLLFPCLSLLTLVLGLCYLVLPLPASFWDSLVGEYPFGIYCPD